MSVAEIRRFLVERIAGLSGASAGEIDCDRPFEEFGLASRDAVTIAGELEERLDRGLPATLVWEYPTINRLAEELAGAPESVAAGHEGGADEPIAVVGIGCRLPGGIAGPDRFWQALIRGEDRVVELPEGRWDDFRESGDLVEVTSRHGGFLDDVAGFDAEFFGISPREAETMDPQQRMLLEVAWEALDHAAIAPGALRSTRTAVFTGISGNEYGYLSARDPGRIEAWTATGAALSIAAGRLSYLLDLRGPSLAVDTACSSSLVATHLAVRSLRAGESDLALAAGASVEGGGWGLPCGTAGAHAWTELAPDKARWVIGDRLAVRAAAVLGLEPSWLDPRTPLVEAGLDSLAATRIRNAVQHDFAVEVPTTLLLQRGTLTDLEDAVAAPLGIAAEKIRVIMQKLSTSGR